MRTCNPDAAREASSGSGEVGAAPRRDDLLQIGAIGAKEVGHMGCLFAMFAGFFPRIALVVLWIATDLVDRAFSTWVIPLLGLIFLPFTTLIYAIAWAPGVHLGNGRWVWVAIAFAVELMGYAGTARTNRERMTRA
jgi:hypothetical protein